MHDRNPRAMSAVHAETDDIRRTLEGMAYNNRTLFNMMRQQSQVSQPQGPPASAYAATSVAPSVHDIGPSVSQVDYHRVGANGASGSGSLRTFAVQRVRMLTLTLVREEPAAASATRLVSFEPNVEQTRLAAEEATTYRPTTTPAGQALRRQPVLPPAAVGPRLALTSAEQQLEHLLSQLKALGDTACWDFMPKLLAFLRQPSMPRAPHVDHKVYATVQRAEGDDTRQPAPHLLHRNWTAAFVLNVDPAFGISFEDAHGTQLSPYKVIMIDSGADVNAMTHRQSIMLGATCVQVHMQVIAFGDNRCGVTKMATNVLTTLFLNTGEEIRLRMDYLVMPDTDQYQFLFGQPFLAHYRVCGMVSTYLDSLLVFPQLGFQPRTYTRAHGLGRMLEIPVSCHRTS
jgi:hypothetical protein